MKTAPGSIEQKAEAERANKHAVFHDSEGAIKDTFGADVAKKRRIWHGKEVCILDARD